MEAGEREYFLQEQRRHPLTLIRSRSRPEFQAEAGPRGRLDDREVETLTLTLAGAMTHLLLDPASHRVLAIRYQGRANGVVGQVE